MFVYITRSLHKLRRMKVIRNGEDDSVSLSAIVFSLWTIAFSVKFDKFTFGPYLFNIMYLTTLFH
jgi:hypothetical protein